MSRWKDNNTTGKKVPKKVLRYFPIIPRLQRLYKSSHTTREMTWHATGKCTDPGVDTTAVDTGQEFFNMRAMVFMDIHDFPARNSFVWVEWERLHEHAYTVNEGNSSIMSGVKLKQLMLVTEDS
ncbi:hypothetical protein Tco_0945175 [Tanacetum coccineum]